MLEPLRKIAGHQLHIAHIDVGCCRIRLQRKRCFVAGRGFGMAVQIVQRDSAIAVGIGMIRLDCQRAVLCCHGLVMTRELVQGHAAIDMGVQKAGVVIERQIILHQRFIITIQLAQRESQVGARNRVVGHEINGPLQAIHRLQCLSFLQRDHTQQMMGFGIRRILVQQPLQNFTGRRMLRLPDKAQGLLDCRITGQRLAAGGR